MSTHIQVLAESIDERWAEVDQLLATAANEATEPALQNALCRSALVMLCAHFEGFLKDVIRQIILDLNKCSNFKSIHPGLKRAFCRALIGNKSSSKDENAREEKLMSILEDSNAKIDHAVWGEWGGNPNPETIERMARDMGFERFFARIVGTKADEVFAGSSADEMLAELHAILISITGTFPYQPGGGGYFTDSPKARSRSEGGGKRTLWEEFLDEFLRQRNEIAHGSARQNSLALSEIRQIQTKVKVLAHMFALALCSCHALPPPSPGVMYAMSLEGTPRELLAVLTS